MGNTCCSSRTRKNNEDEKKIENIPKVEHSKDLLVNEEGLFVSNSLEEWFTFFKISDEFRDKINQIDNFHTVEDLIPFFSDELYSNELMAVASEEELAEFRNAGELTKALKPYIDSASISDLMGLGKPVRSGDGLEFFQKHWEIANQLRPNAQEIDVDASQHNLPFFIKSAPFGKYCTISHVWGNTKPTPLGSNGDVPLSSSEKAQKLLSLSSTSEFPLWLDVISIDQNDATNKSMQVSIMDKIYSSCQSTYILLDCQSFEKVVNFRNDLKDIFQSENEESLKSKLLDPSLRYILPTVSMLGSYSARVWTFQEHVLSKHPIYCCENGSCKVHGNIEIDAETLSTELETLRKEKWEVELSQYVYAPDFAGIAIVAPDKVNNFSTIKEELLKLIIEWHNTFKMIIYPYRILLSKNINQIMSLFKYTNRDCYFGKDMLFGSYKLYVPHLQLEYNDPISKNLQIYVKELCAMSMIGIGRYDGNLEALNQAHTFLPVSWEELTDNPKLLKNLLPFHDSIIRREDFLTMACTPSFSNEMKYFNCRGFRWHIIDCSSDREHQKIRPPTEDHNTNWLRVLYEETIRILRMLVRTPDDHPLHPTETEIALLIKNFVIMKEHSDIMDRNEINQYFSLTFEHSPRSLQQYRTFLAEYLKNPELYILKYCKRYLSYNQMNAPRVMTILLYGGGHPLEVEFTRTKSFIEMICCVPNSVRVHLEGQMPEYQEDPLTEFNSFQVMDLKHEYYRIAYSGYNCFLIHGRGGYAMTFSENKESYSGPAVNKCISKVGLLSFRKFYAFKGKEVEFTLAPDEYLQTKLQFAKDEVVEMAFE